MRKFKIREEVKCKKGYNNSCNGGTEPINGGRGYIEDFKFIINKITVSNSGNKIAWKKDSSQGIYFQALELLTPEKIELNYEIY